MSLLTGFVFHLSMNLDTTHTALGGGEHEESQAIKLKDGTSGHDNDRSPLHPVEVILIMNRMNIISLHLL